MEKHKKCCDCNETKINTINVIDALLSMKGGKSADSDNISAEHLHHAPLNLPSRLATHIDQMLRHSFVPSQFRQGFMLPLVKDQQGNHADINIYCIEV